MVGLTQTSEVMTVPDRLYNYPEGMTSLGSIQDTTCLFQPYRNHWAHSLRTPRHLALLDTQACLV